MKVLDRLSELFADLLRQDERRVLLGEDVADGGMLGWSRAAAADPALASRVISTPLHTSASVTHAAGMALGGARPIVLQPSAGALLESLPALRELARLRHRTRSGGATPVLLVAPSGPGFGLGGDWAASPESVLSQIPGLRVVAAGTPGRVAHLVRAAASFEASPDPTVLLLPRTLLLHELLDASADDADVQIDIEAAGVHAGHDPSGNGPAATVFAWGDAYADAAAAVSQAQATLERAVDLVDVASLSPLDEGTLVEAAARSGKIVIAHAGRSTMGVAAELAALFADRNILQLDAPVMRVGGAAEAFGDEATLLPGVDAITNAILTVATY